MSVSRALDLPQTERPAAQTAVRAVDVSAAQRSTAAGLFSRPLVPIMTALGVTLLVVFCVVTARSAGLVAALWGASALAVAVWLRGGRGLGYDLAFGGLITVGFVAGEFLAGNGVVLSAVFTLANMLEVVAAVLLARHFAPTMNLANVEGAGRFLIAVAIIAPVPSALFTAGFLALTRDADFLVSFQTWWFGHALGFAIITPFGLALTGKSLEALREPWRVVEAVLLFACLLAICGLVFFRYDIQVAFVVIPMLILIAARLRVLGITTALLIVSVSAVASTLVGHGPFQSAADTVADRALLAQLMVLFGCLPILLVASLLEERDRLSERAKAAQRRAEMASAAKSRLLANVAHEIKSPVGGVIGIGDLWSTGQLGPITPTQKEMGEMLVKTARQIEALSHDLLDVARAEAGTVKVEPRPTDVPGVLEDVRRTTALRAEAEHVRLEVVCESDGLIALADSQRLTQVIDNLATNAVKYGGAGGVVQFRARRIHDGVRIEVIDRGPGLSPEKQAQLFEPFNRLGLERSTVEGHGIGLALAKRLVELQGGTIGVISTPGEGATFWIELPAA